MNTSLRNIKAIAQRELTGYFSSPVPYVFLVMFCSYGGCLFMAGGYLAISCMTSAITRNQVVSFIVSVVLCLFLILAGFPPVTEFLSKLTTKSWIVDGVAALSVITHFEAFQR